MPSIRDKQINRFFNEAEFQNTKSINDQNVLKILAAVGDINQTTSGQLLEKMQQPGISRQEQFDLAKNGLSNKERRDINTLLDNNEITLSPGAKNFLQALVGQAELKDSFGPLQLQVDNNLSGGLKGVTNPGDEIEVVNISANPEGVESSEVIKLKADQWGQFKGDIPNAQEGDILRVRSRSAGGNVSNWISLQANGLGEDTRNAQVYTDAIGLESNAPGELSPVYIGDGMVSEPGAQLRFINERTGKSATFTVDENGQLPAGSILKGNPSDVFKIAVSDGTNNVDFSEAAGSITMGGTDPVVTPEQPTTVDLKDPALREKHLNGNYKVERFTGPLFVDGASPSDVKQGSIGNCYFAAAMGSIAQSNPEKLQDMIKDNGDGSYDVTFKVKSGYGYRAKYKDKTVTVDGDLVVRSPGGRPLYGAANTNYNDKEKMEMWYPIVEKAYAALHGNSYHEVGDGGRSSDVFESVLGGNASYKLISSGPERIYKQIAEASEKGWPVAASTYGKDSPEAERYAGAKLYAWHAYSVLGVEEEGGKKYVQLRNPWGNTEPGNDGKNDGIFRLDIEQFDHFFRGVYIGKHDG